MWPQVYDPFGSMVLSTLVAAIPIVVLLGAIGLFHMKAHYAAGLGLVASLAVAIVGFGMPVRHGEHVGGLWRRLRDAADRLDHPERHLPLPAYERERANSRSFRTASPRSPATAGCNFC